MHVLCVPTRRTAPLPRPPPAGPPSLVRPSVSAAASSGWRQPPLHRHDSSGSEAASVAPSEASSVWPSGLSAQWLRAPSGTALGASPLVQMSGEGRGRLLAWRASVLSTEASLDGCSSVPAGHARPLICCPHLAPGPPPRAAASLRQQQERGGVLDLPAGASAVPLPLAPHLPTHTISFRCVPPPEFAAAAAADALPLWSRPVTVRDGIEAQFHLVVPVAQPPEPQQQGGGEQGDAAAEGERRQGSGDAAHLSAGASGDAAHLTAAAAAARGVVAGRPAANSAAWQPAVAILRLSVHRRGAGALHVVLESMQCDPPYLLENRTPVPLQYRQVRAPCRRLCKAEMRLLRAAVDCRRPAIGSCNPPHSPAPDAR